MTPGVSQIMTRKDVTKTQGRRLNQDEVLLISQPPDYHVIFIIKSVFNNLSLDRTFSMPSSQFLTVLIYIIKRMHIPEFCKVLYNCLSSEMKERSNVVEVGKRNQNRTELTEPHSIQVHIQNQFQNMCSVDFDFNFRTKKNCPN